MKTLFIIKIFVAACFLSGCSRQQRYSIFLSPELEGRYGQDGKDIRIKEVSIRLNDARVKSILTDAWRKMVEQEAVQQFESELIEIDTEIPGLIEIRNLISECQRRIYISNRGLADDVDLMINLFPSVEITQRDKRVTSIKVDKQSLLIILFGDRSSVANKYSIGLIPLSDAGSDVLVSEENLVDRSSVFVRLFGHLCGVDNGVELRSDNWLVANRLVAQQIKNRKNREFRVVKWKEFFRGKESNRLVAGQRFEVPIDNFAIPVRWVPGGQFAMGSRAGEPGRLDDEVQHQVLIRNGFLVCETECTQEIWVAMMTNNPSHFKGGSLPVEQVSWDSAVEFCRKLTDYHIAEGLIPSGVSWRLPTEAEWEYVCRAGSPRDFPGDINLMGWTLENAGYKTHPVGLKKPNEWGISDMNGNVWEWCLDWYNNYPRDTSVDPLSQSVSMGRVFRGGGWYLDRRYGRSASRRWSAPNLKYSYVGFRPVLAFSVTPSTERH